MPALRRSNMESQLLEISGNLLILAGRIEVFREMLAADGFLQELLIDVMKDVDQGAVGDGLHAVEDLFVALLGNDAVGRIAVAVAEAEQLLEEHLQIELGAPAKALGKGQGDAVTIIDLGEHIAVGGIDQVATDHARETVARQHGALAGAAAGHDVVGSAAGQQQRGQQTALDISELAGVLGGIHTIVDDGVAHGFHDLLQGGLDHGVLSRLTVFVDQGDTHGYFILSFTGCFPYDSTDAGEMQIVPGLIRSGFCNKEISVIDFFFLKWNNRDKIRKNRTGGSDNEESIAACFGYNPACWRGRVNGGC